MVMALSRMAEKLQCCSRASNVSGPRGQPRKVLSRCAVPRRSCGTGGGVQPAGLGHGAGGHGDTGLTRCSSS